MPFLMNNSSFEEAYLRQEFAEPSWTIHTLNKLHSLEGVPKNVLNM